MGQLKYSAVPMRDVPDPPLGNRNGRVSELQPLYNDLLKLDSVRGASSALLINCIDKKDLLDLRSRLRKFVASRAKDHLLCSSRSPDYKELYVWLIKKEQVAR